MGEAIESKHYRHPDGRTASLYGAHPGPGFEVVTKGWTIRHPDGTEGIGRKPFETQAEAQAWIDANPHFRGMQQD